jgi:hypothetical protein
VRGDDVFGDSPKRRSYEYRDPEIDGMFRIFIARLKTIVQAVNRRCASRYFSAVRVITSGGSFGPGGFLSQSSVSR